MYFSIRKSAPELRAKHLDSLAEAWAAEGNSPKEKILKQLINRENIKSSHKKIKYLRGKLEHSSTTMITILDDQQCPKDLINKVDIENAILRENAGKFQQAFNSPFYTAPLAIDCGYKALTPAANQVLLGVYNPPPDTIDTLKKYIEQLAIPLHARHSITTTQESDFSMSLDEHIRFWNGAKEDTSCFPCALLFAMMKKGAKDATVAEVDLLAAQIPLKGGFSPDAWHHAIDVMIPKKAGNTQLSSLRTIVLFPVDCNYVFKFFGKKMMKRAERIRALAPEQYGSRKKHKAIDLAVCKALTYDLLRQLKRPGAFCCNNAKSCYDLIGHAQASLSMQRVGLPAAAVNCMLTTLQIARHYVRTGYGDSVGFYTGSSFAKPLHGIGQGNGAGPAIWAVVSSPVLNLMRASGHGAELICPLSHVKSIFTGYAFVDDTDLVVAKFSFRNFTEAAQALQAAMNTWEQGIKATSGAIVPEKTYVYLIDFEWQAGTWSYLPCAKSPATFTVQDIHGQTRPVNRFEVWEAQETLGVYLAPDGNTQAQFDKMYNKVIQWTDHMRTGRISKNEIWLAFTTTIWRTLCYPLPAINLSRKQCEKLMTPLLNYVLPALGICRTFPRNLVFAPLQYMGLGIKHIHTVQDINRLKDILHHAMQNSLMGSRCRV
jgi:hypothetical protein